MGRIFVDADERIWIHRRRPDPTDDWGTLYGAPGGIFDVFDRAGAYLGEVHAPETARLQAAAGDVVIGLEHGAFDEPWIVAYRLE